MRWPATVRTIGVWCVLCVATIANVSLRVLEQSPPAAIERLARLLLLAIAFFKVRLVLMHFMEIDRERLALRIAAEAWVMLTCGALMIQLW
jgi:Prokaryotic Cytochrome C oxidase subunit IV